MVETTKLCQISWDGPFSPGCRCRVEYKLPADRLLAAGTEILTAEKLVLVEAVCPEQLEWHGEPKGCEWDICFTVLM